MQINSSYSILSSLPLLLSPINNSFEPQNSNCFSYSNTIFIAVSFTVTKTTLLLPLSILILYLGHQRWQQKRSFTTSHPDIFNYCMMVIELISVLGWIFYCYGTYINLPSIVLTGFYMIFIVFPGQMFFHCLTCVERYLAVAHPITYMTLRKTHGVRIRNICIGFVWLLCFGWIRIISLYYPFLPNIPLFCLLAFSVIVVSFCSFSVLCVLIRPGPGKVGGNRERLDQSKRRAVNTIMAIMGVLMLYFLGFTVCIALRVSELLSYSDSCVMIVSAIWFSLPSSLLLPVLFLHRAGKLTFCCGNTDT